MGVPPFTLQLKKSMKTLQFPDGWFTQNDFKRKNGIPVNCQRKLVKNLTINGSIESRTISVGKRIMRVYRKIGSVGEVRDRIYSPKILSDFFSSMGLIEMPVLTNETQPVN